MKHSILFMFLVSTLYSIGQSQPEINVVYGDHHIFTMETPEGWVNDKHAASKIGLVSYFYAKADTNKLKRSYMYAMGYDKNPSYKDLIHFVSEDIKDFKNKNPALTYEQVKVSKSGAIVDATMMSFANLNDRFKEEVIYLETDLSILIFVFSALSETEYQKYQPVFDQLVASFTYRGNDPEPFLERQKTKIEQ